MLSIYNRICYQSTITFFQSPPELVLTLFLIFGQSEPHYSYKVILIKKRRVLCT